ncbi:MAG: ABC transporter permease [Anaerolineales bacterium]|nr:ABC transporter permease [Anaerolineales bacterium]
MTAVSSQKVSNERRTRTTKPRWMKTPFIISGSITLFFIFIAVFASIIAPEDPYVLFSGQVLKLPSAEHLLGTDELARDLLSRVIYAAQTSLLVAFSSVAIATFLGTILGATSAFYGGMTDMIIMRFMDVLLTFPSMVLTIAVVAFLGNTTLNVILVIGLLYTPGTARIVYSSALTVKQMDYVEAAHMLGISNWRIITRHILPNAMAPLLAQIALNLGFAILTESGLSFLGLGTPAPTPTWGTMISIGRKYIHRQPWLLFVPMTALSLAIVSFNVLSDSLRDILDPRLKLS